MVRALQEKCYHKRMKQDLSEDDKRQLTIDTDDIMCVQIAALCHDLGKSLFPIFFP